MFSHIYYFRKSGRLIGPIGVSFFFSFRSVRIASKSASERASEPSKIPPVSISARGGARRARDVGPSVRRGRGVERRIFALRPATRLCLCDAAGRLARERAGGCEKREGEARREGAEREPPEPGAASSSRRGFCRACGERDARDPRVTGSVHWKSRVT